MTERDGMIEVMARALAVQALGTVAHVSDYRADARAALLALEASGRRVVPVEATEGMKLAAGELIRQGSRKGEPLRPETIWGVFLAWAQYELSAAPGAPE